MPTHFLTACDYSYLTADVYHQHLSLYHDQKTKIRSVIWPSTDGLKGAITDSPGNNVFHWKLIIIVFLINNMYFLKSKIMPRVIQYNHKVLHFPHMYTDFVFQCSSDSQIRSQRQQTISFSLLFINSFSTQRYTRDCSLTPCPSPNKVNSKQG